MISKINLILGSPLFLSRDIEPSFRGRITETMLCVTPLNNYAFWALHNPSDAVSMVDYARREIPIRRGTQLTRAFHGVEAYEHDDRDFRPNPVVKLTLEYLDDESMIKPKWYKVKRSAKIGEVIRKFVSERLGRPMTRLNFYFVDFPLNLEATWNDVPGLRNEGKIDIFDEVIPRGGGKRKAKRTRRKRKTRRINTRIRKRTAKTKTKK